MTVTPNSSSSSPAFRKRSQIGETLLSYRLAIALKNRKLTHEQAARLIGVGRYTFSDTLYCKNFNPNLRTLVKMVKWLDGDLSRIHDYIIDFAGHHIPALTKKGS